jgi:hypothetical protein
VRSPWLAIVAVLGGGSILLAQTTGPTVPKSGSLAAAVAAAKRDGRTEVVPLQRYVLAGDFCKNGTFVLGDVEYPVSGDDVVLQPSGRPVTPRITLDELIRLLRKAPNSSRPSRFPRVGHVP